MPIREVSYIGSRAYCSQTHCYSLADHLIDGLGSVLTSFSGSAIQGELLYGPYGNQQYVEGSLGTDKGYTGQVHDAVTGLDYYNARYYDPVIGQFLSSDSVQGNAQGMDPYAYVGGNPETRTDPTGEKSVECVPGSEGCNLEGVSISPGGNPPSCPKLNPGCAADLANCQENASACSGNPTPPLTPAMSKPKSPKQKLRVKNSAGGFPPGTTYRSTNKKASPPYQVWLSDLEYDPVFGWHYNLHFQPVGGGDDYHNYHITYVETDPERYIWKVFDDITGASETYVWTKPPCTCEEGNDNPLSSLNLAAENLSLFFASDVSQRGTALNDTIQDDSLAFALWQPLETAFVNLAHQAGDV